MWWRNLLSQVDKYKTTTSKKKNYFNLIYNFKRKLITLIFLILLSVPIIVLFSDVSILFDIKQPTCFRLNIGSNAILQNYKIYKCKNIGELENN